MELIRWVGQGCVHEADQVGGGVSMEQIRWVGQGCIHGADQVGGAANCRWESGCVSA